MLVQLCGLLCNVFDTGVDLFCIPVGVKSLSCYLVSLKHVNDHRSLLEWQNGKLLSNILHNMHNQRVGTNSMRSSARKYEKPVKNGHWNFRKIIAWKTSLV